MVPPDVEPLAVDPVEELLVAPVLLGMPEEVPPDVLPVAGPLRPGWEVVPMPEPEPVPTLEEVPPGRSALLPGPTPVLDELEPVVFALELLPETALSEELGREAPAPVSIVTLSFVVPLPVCRTA